MKLRLHYWDCLWSPVAPGMSHNTYLTFALGCITGMLNLQPGNLPQDHFNQQDFPNTELCYGSLAPCNVTKKDPGYRLFILRNIVKDQIISWYAKEFISMKDTVELKVCSNRHSNKSVRPLLELKATVWSRFDIWSPSRNQGFSQL